jgi:hypothetical protein
MLFPGKSEQIGETVSPAFLWMNEFHENIGLRYPYKNTPICTYCIYEIYVACFYNADSAAALDIFLAHSLLSPVPSKK